MKLIQGSFTKRALIVGLIAGSGILAASSAMSDGGPVSKAGCEARHGQKDHAKWEVRRSGHLAELKEKLKLTPEQQVAWNAFTGASQPGMRPMAVGREAMRDEFEKLSTPQRLDKMLAMSETRRANMVERAEATKALYAQLSPEQQSVFDAEVMPRRNKGHHHHRHYF